MKIVIDLNDKDYELLKNAGITIDFNTLFHGKERDRELTFSTFNLIESLKNGTPYEESPQGKWERRTMNDYRCSNCHYKVDSVERLVYKFCPKCGTAMKKENENESES